MKWFRELCGGSTNLYPAPASIFVRRQARGHHDWTGGAKHRDTAGCRARGQSESFRFAIAPASTEAGTRSTSGTQIATTARAIMTALQRRSGRQQV